VKPWEKYGATPPVAPAAAQAPAPDAPGPWQKHQRQGVFYSALNAFNDALLPDVALDALGLPKPNPQTQGERIADSAGRMVGQTAPLLLGMGGLARAIPGLAPGAVAPSVGEGVMQALVQPFRAAPISAMAGEAISAAGAGAGGQIAQEMVPDSPSARAIGEVAGGFAPSALGKTPTGIAVRAASRLASRLSPEAQTRAAQQAVVDTLGPHLAPGAEQGIRDAEQVLNAVPGFEPSLAEATGSPALVATQRSIESRAEGADLERFTRRHDENTAALDRFAGRSAPEGEGAEAVTGRGRQRIDTATGRVERDQAAATQSREDLAQMLPVIDRAGVGDEIRERIRTARNETRGEMNRLAEELGINDADVSMEFGPARAEIERQFKPRSVLEDETKIPPAVGVLRRLDVEGSPLLGPNGKPLAPGKGTAPVTFKDLRLYRERIGDDLRDAQSSATPNRALIRNLVTLRKQVDDSIDRLAENADPELAAKYRQFRDAYYQRYVQRFERGAVAKVNQKDGSGFYRTPDEKVADAFFAPGNVTAARQYRAVFGDSPEAEADLATAALDSLRNAAVRDGILDERAFATWRRQHASVLDEFPAIREIVDNGGAANAALAGRQRVLAERQKRIEDTLLARELQSIDRGTKTPEQVIDAALKNPRKMDQVLKSVRGYPEAAAGLRRALWERAQTGTAEDTATFMAEHEATLRQVLSSEHWNNLIILQKGRAMMERVGAPRGKGVSPEPLKAVQDAIGMGVNQLASRIFAAESGRTSWRYIGIDAMGRFLRGRSQAQTAALFNQALYDPRVARAMSDMLTKADMPPIASRKLNAWLWQAGLTPDVGAQDDEP
jgi:hypothetical protein